MAKKSKVVVREVPSKVKIIEKTIVLPHEVTLEEEVEDYPSSQRFDAIPTSGAPTLAQRLPEQADHSASLPVSTDEEVSERPVQYRPNARPTSYISRATGQGPSYEDAVTRSATQQRVAELERARPAPVLGTSLTSETASAGRASEFVGTGNQLNNANNQEDDDSRRYVSTEERDKRFERRRDWRL